MAFSNPIPKLFDDPKPLAPSTPISTTYVPSESNSLNYEFSDNTYFAFIDVLGFKQTFDENRKDSTHKFAESFSETFKYYNHLMRASNFASVSDEWHAGQTSDSLFFYTTRLDCLASFIKIYIHFSLFAMSKNVFFRGGIAKGGLHYNSPTQFYGDSVIKAYYLESTIAQNPIVALDELTYKALKDDNEISGFLQENRKGKRYYLKPFINTPPQDILALLKTDQDDVRDTNSSEFWNLVEKNISENLQRFEFDSKNYGKYVYLSTEYEIFKKKSINCN